MNILVILIPVSLTLGGLGLALFLWTMKHQQYEDPQGDGARILSEDFDKTPNCGLNRSGIVGGSNSREGGAS